MSSPYERVKGGRLTFKDGSLATRSNAIDKKKKKKKKKKHTNPNSEDMTTTGHADLDVHAGDAAEEAEAAVASASAEGGPDTYTIDAAKRMKYEQLFPVEAKKFGYDPKSLEHKSVEDLLDDRAKKKADRYCK